MSTYFEQSTIWPARYTLFRTCMRMLYMTENPNDLDGARAEHCGAHLGSYSRLLV